MSLEPILLMSEIEEIRSDFSDRPFKAGNTLVVDGPWLTLVQLQHDRGFLIVSPAEGAAGGHRRLIAAVGTSALGVALALSGLPIALRLLTGAVGMVLFRVATIDEAYRAIDWRTAFLPAGLIPPGIAMEATGAAAFVSGHAARLVDGSPPVLLHVSVDILATVFALFMSNVAATIVLVPLSIAIAGMSGLDGRPLALLIAICASNSSLLPTHQVNAPLVGPGGYRNADSVKAGGLMTALFLLIAVSIIYLWYS